MTWKAPRGRRTEHGRPRPAGAGASSWRLPLGRPLVIGHRGASSSHAEHTLTAYQRALEEGADGVECDVRLTADGHLVCVHDRRVERTSNGRGVVSELALDELESLDFSSWKQNGDAPEVVPGEGVVTLQRLLGVIHDWGRPVEVAIETKHPTRYAGLVERRLVETLDHFGWARPRGGTASPARVMSKSWLSLRRCLELAPRLETVFLMKRIPTRRRDGSLPLGASVAGPSIRALRDDPGYVERAHTAGHEVHVWVVNSDSDLRLCAELSVDGVITDYPGWAMSGAGPAQ